MNESPNIEEVCDEVINGNGKTRRTTAVLAALGLIIITSGATAGLVYDIVFNNNQQSLTQIGTLATLGVGGLLALAGAKREGN